MTRGNVGSHIYSVRNVFLTFLLDFTVNLQVIGSSVLFTGSGFQLIEGIFKLSLLILHHGFISLLISVPPKPELVPCYVMLHHNAANTDPYIFHINPLYVHHIVWVESYPVMWKVNLCSMPLSDIHFDFIVFSLVSVWATFVMHDTGPRRQSFSHIDCQIYIEHYMVQLGLVLSVLSGDITFCR